MTDHPNKTAELTYSLTRLQRLGNPPEVFLYRVLGCVAVLATIFAVVAIKDIYGSLVCLLVLCVYVLVYRRPLLTGVWLLFERDPVRCIVVGPDVIGFGKRNVEYRISRKSVRVHKGLFGTHLIRHALGHALIVSKDAISLSELRTFVAMDRADADNSREGKGSN